MERLTTIRQRLRLSNILTLLVPLATCIVVALICVAVFLIQVRGGLDLEISDAEDMTTMGRVVSETAGHILNETEGDHTAALDDLAQSVAGSGGMLQILDGTGNIFYSSGTPVQRDSLLASARALDDTDGVLVSAAGTSLYLHKEGSYHIALFANYAEVRGHAIKRALLISGLVVLAAAIVSLLLMDRLGRHLVYDRIESGLAELGDGVSRIADGDLRFRIAHAEQDEFAPICDDFNEMAGRLEEAEERELAEERRRLELILPLAGFFSRAGALWLPLAIVSATIGSLAGAYVLYAVGTILNEGHLERVLASKPAHLLGFEKSDVKAAFGWFDTKGQKSVLICRRIPIARSLISIPAGMSRMKLGKFTAMTFAGSLSWNTALVVLGCWAGSAWEGVAAGAASVIDIVTYIVLAAAGVAALIWFCKRILPRIKSQGQTPSHAA